MCERLDDGDTLAGRSHMIVLDFSSPEMQGAIEWIQEFDATNGVGEDHPLAKMLRYIKEAL